MRRVASTIGIAAALLTAGCGSDDRVTTTTSRVEATALAGRVFLSSSATEAGGPRPLAGPRPIRLSFEESRFSADPGCNSLGGSYRITGGRLQVGELATTEMACEDPALMEQDRWFADLLLATPTITLSADELILTGGDTSIVFTDREVAVPDRPLAGSWTVEGIVEGELASSAPADVDATVTIDDELRTVTWYAGCDGARAPMRVTGSTMTIEESQPVTRPCAPPPPELTSAAAGLLDTMSTVLNGEVNYEIDGTTLTITARGRSLQLRSS
jgi:heat shock protein HslJ